ncbi:hypothetical protein Q7P37_000451 [Cladosporium fusiforme]
METTPNQSDSNAESRKRRIKAHRKSRGGCAMCKTRKVKCSESRPKCSNCIKLGDECVYASPAQEMKQVVRFSAPKRSATGFNLRDLRFFHSFLTAAYPSFPLECDRAWVLDVPLIAQQYDYLNAAILSLGAAHLQATTDLDLEQTVQKYRFSAIRGVNLADELELEKSPDPSISDRATAILAACYALTFISLYMGDPVSNFLVLVRGCASLSRRMVQAGLTSPFFPPDEMVILNDPHIAVIRKQLHSAQPLPPAVTAAARGSLRLLETTCDLRPHEKDMLSRMQSIVAVTSGPIEAANHYLFLWGLFTEMDPCEFDHFTTSSNMTAVVLQVHFLALELMMRPWLQKYNIAFHQTHNRVLKNTSLSFTSTASAADVVCFEKLVSWPREFLEVGRDVALIVEGDVEFVLGCHM